MPVNDIDMKLGSVTKHDKRNTATSEKLMIMSYQQIMPLLLF